MIERARQFVKEQDRQIRCSAPMKGAILVVQRLSRARRDAVLAWSHTGTQAAIKGVRYFRSLTNVHLLKVILSPPCYPRGE
eukprot:3016579-Pleurochrysis_carterae.AAC.2